MNSVPDWMTKERTVLVKKNKEQGAAVSNSTKIGQSFHKEIIFHEKTFQVKIWPISRLNDSETRER